MKIARMNKIAFNKELRVQEDKKKDSINQLK